MVLQFPKEFIFGTSTAAYQIETAVGHDWCDVRARDGFVFNRTTDHEKHYAEDVESISSLAPHYRMSLMWSRLQHGPMGRFNPTTVEEYTHLLDLLEQRGVKIMMVLHHFANPRWFAQLGGWEKGENIALFVDFAKKLVDTFGHRVFLWNTFNEPNLYTSMGWVASEFPPYKRNILTAYKVINNIAKAHDLMYDYIKSRFPETKVGISHNCTLFEGDNVLGKIPAKVIDYCYMEYPSSLFQKTDFFGMSYYARIGHDPFPTTYLTSPKKLERKGKPHDDMWEYYPQGIRLCMTRFWNQYKKPIIITENGICSPDDSKRVNAIKDYLKEIHQAMEEGVEVLGYYHWSTWDNFEWSLGPTYQFGLYSCDLHTKKRTRKASGDVYAAISRSGRVTI